MSNRRKDFAKSRSVVRGKKPSERVRRASEATVQTRVVNGFYAVVLPARSPKISSRKIKHLLGACDA